MAAGVAFVINKKLLSYVLTVQPISDRLMILILNGPSNIVVVNTYAPPAPSTDEQKDTYYILLDEHIQLYHKHKTMYLLGDMNARLHCRQDPDETPIGPYTFDSDNNRLATQSEEAHNNRIRKPDKYLATFRELANNHGHPYNRN
eukprot:12421491-Karenia_brevis.AAC.1